MKRTVVEELHRPARRNYQRRSFDVRGLDETWQADLVEMQPYSTENRGYRYMLTVIDVFSKFAWALPLKTKTGEDVTTAMGSILQQGRVPKNLQVDRGKEFFNKSFQSLMDKYNINLYSTHSNLKASICERLNRTLKSKMWKEFSFQGNYKWLEILSELLENYNNSKHRTINMKPKDVTSVNEAQVMKKFKIQRTSLKKAKFKINAKVRVSKVKQLFEKGYTPNWSTEIFTIKKILNTNPITYHLEDYQGQPVAGCFYEQELSKVKYPDVYLVEKVMRKRGDKIYVKWLGFDDSHNSWIDKKDM